MFGKPDHRACSKTTRFLDRHRIPYTLRDITGDSLAAAQIEVLGHLDVPVVVAGEQHWSGHQYERLAALADQIEQDRLKGASDA